MEYIRTFIAGVEFVELAREALAEVEGGQGMLVVPISASGAIPVEAYVSSGWVSEDILSVAETIPGLRVYDDPPEVVLDILGKHIIPSLNDLQ